MVTCPQMFILEPRKNMLIRESSMADSHCSTDIMPTKGHHVFSELYLLSWAIMVEMCIILEFQK